MGLVYKTLHLADFCGKCRSICQLHGSYGCFLAVFVFCVNKTKHIPPGKLTWLAGKWTLNEDVFPIEDDFFFHCHVSLPECIKILFWVGSTGRILIFKFVFHMFLLIPSVPSGDQSCVFF